MVHCMNPCAYAERQLNSHIAGYTFHIGSLDFHPIGLSIDLENVTVVRDANPDPPRPTWQNGRPAFIGKRCSPVVW